jgi:hypothetical protein
MEIKNCEQYVVTKLIDLENEVEKQRKYIEEQKNQIIDLAEKLEFVGKFLYIEKSSSKTEYYVDFKNRWSSYDKEDYDRLCAIFNLTYDEEDE